MNRSLKNWSSLAFEYGNPLRLAVFGVFALALSWVLLDAYFFLIRIYAGEQVLDVPSNGFLQPLTVFVILALCAGYIMRSIIIYLRLRLLFRKQLIIAEYQKPTDLTAAEAGYILDRSWSQNETDATIAELASIGAIYQQEGMWHHNNQVPYNQLAYYHPLFIESVFGGATQITESELRDARLSQRIASTVHHSLVQRGYLKDDLITTRLLPFFRVTFYVALLYGALSIWYVLENGLQALVSNHGEVYPFYLWQLIAGTLIPLTLVMTTLSGFLAPVNPLVQKPTDRRFVAGLKLYLETVFADRVNRYGQSAVDEEFTRTFYPYMVAFGIVNLDTSD